MLSTTKYNGCDIVYLNGYPCIYQPDSLYAYKNGLVPIHVLVAEKLLGRQLNNGECVHHCDENKDNFEEKNIWVFKTGGDHSRYHHALKHHLDYIIISKNNIKECVLDDSKYKYCPICGNLKTYYAKYCNDCLNKLKAQHIPEKGLLKKLLHIHNYSQIGRMYNVSPNAVKKWAKKYNLYQPVFKSAPSKEELSQKLASSQKKVVAKNYGVNVCTVDRWIKELDIHVKPLHQVICCETGVSFPNRIAAAKSVYPEYNPKYAANQIAKCCQTGSVFCNFHWLQDKS